MAMRDGSQDHEMEVDPMRANFVTPDSESVAAGHILTIQESKIPNTKDTVELNGTIYMVTGRRWFYSGSWDIALFLVEM